MTKQFSTIEPVTKGKPPSYKWHELQHAMFYDVGHVDSGDRVNVPKGFETDFASIPRVLWSILPPFGRYLPAAIIHDYLYIKQPRTRKQADAIFLEGMQALGVPWLRRQVMHKAVRMGGSFSWAKRKKNIEESIAA